MSAEPVVYLDSSALVKLVVREPESAALRSYLRSKASRVSSALARVEVVRAVAPHGPGATARARQVLEATSLLALDDALLDAAGALEAPGLRGLDAIHERGDELDRRHVRLEPRPRAGGADVFHADERSGAHDHRDVGRGRRLRLDEVAAIGRERAHPHGSHAEGRGVLVAEELRLGARARNVDEDARHEAQLLEGGAVVPEREVVLDRAGDVGEDGPGKVPAGGVLEVVEREDAVQHRRIFA